MNGLTINLRMCQVTFLPTTSVISFQSQLRETQGP